MIGIIIVTYISMLGKSMNNTAILKKTTKTSAKLESLDDFLKFHIKKKEDPKEITNTRIGSQELGIYGGSYHIKQEEYPAFLDSYYDSVFTKKKEEYLTEKQLDKGAILIDIDLRFPVEVKSRVYTDDHINDLLDGCLGIFKKMYQFDHASQFPVYIFEKSKVNTLVDKGVTKDGIHLIIGIQADRPTQMVLRKRLIEYVTNSWSDLKEQMTPTVTWDDVFDEAISKGHANWQMYGSKKPNHEAYRLTKVFDIKYDATDDECSMESVPLESFNLKANYAKLSARYAKHLDPFLKSDVLQEIQSLASHQNARSTANTIINSTLRNAVLGTGQSNNAEVLRVRTKDQLSLLMSVWLESIQPSEYDLQEAYEYTMTLPRKYYDAGSYDRWMRVGFALRNTSDKLFIVWVIFSSQASNFEFSSISDLWENWQKFDLANPRGLTKRSIMHWSKQDAYEKYKKVRESSVDYYIDQTLENAMMNFAEDKKSTGCGDFDIATILYHLFKDQYVCCSVKSNIWFRYYSHRWIKSDSGTTLRRAISEDLRNAYSAKAFKLSQAMNALPEGDERVVNIQKRISKVMDVVGRLSKTHDKQNIMTEAKELFYDGDFLKNLDTNPYLLCFKNGVFDFKEKMFRDGKPEDGISLSTLIEYKAINRNDDKTMKIVEEIQDFMRKLFPREELERYMWDHLASTLIGTASNQTFNNYIGNGQNGKSVLIKLMSMSLGEYKGDVPITLITAKERTKVGGTSSEIVELKGIRYAVMAEPTKNDEVNEGMMKMLTSGVDTLQGRAPFMPETVRFMPQFKLAVASNVYMKVKSQDHGTWRRFRIVLFESLFTENPTEGDTEKPFQFKLDKNLDERFDYWKEIFMSLLVERACQTNGHVEDCSLVMAASNAYRMREDYISDFIGKCIFSAPGKKLKKQTVNSEFGAWFTINYGTKPPNHKEIHANIDQKFGKHIGDGWMDIDIKYSSDDNDIDMDDVPDMA